MKDLAACIKKLESKLSKPLDKIRIAEAVAKEYELICERSVYQNSDFAIRFSSSKNESFSNVVLSLSALAKYDRKPFVVCIVRPERCQMLLSNSTFLKKISHSSHQLRMDNVRGSFLGHDIMREYEGLVNEPANFGELFAFHVEFAWGENLARLVEATTNIAPTGVRYVPSPKEKQNILSSVDLAVAELASPRWAKQEVDLRSVTRRKQDEILKAAERLNVNLRGNDIEQIITGGTNVHGMGDMVCDTDGGPNILIDIKSKLLTRHSAPKGYNIDKLLAALSDGRTVVGFFLVGIDPQKKAVDGRLVSIFDASILPCTRIQFHWAGRNSRGVTQLVGSYGDVLLSTFKPRIDAAAAMKFLKQLLEIGE